MKALYLIENNTPVVVMVTMENEIWRPIPGYEGLYEISTEGRVKALEKVVVRGKQKARFPERILSPVNSLGYRRLQLSKDGVVKGKSIHRLLICTFWDLIPNCPNPAEHPELVTNHKDGVRDNNRLSNLEFITVQENVLHAYRVLKHRGSSPTGENHVRAKLKESDLPLLYNHLAEGKSLCSFAKMKGVERCTVRLIVTGKTWQSVKIDWSQVYKPNLIYSNKNKKSYVK